MTVVQLRALHHAQKRPEKFEYSIKYFSSEKVPGEKNRFYVARLRHVAEEHLSGKGSIELLVDAARAKYPQHL